MEQFNLMALGERQALDLVTMYIQMCIILRIVMHVQRYHSSEISLNVFSTMSVDL